MSPQALAAAIENGTAPAVIDVRSRAEYLAGHVPGAVHLPFWLVPLRPQAVPAGRTDPLVVYCGHGPRARLAGAALRRHGFTQVSYLDGHMAAWAAAGLPLAHGAHPSTRDA